MRVEYLKLIEVYLSSNYAHYCGLNYGQVFKHKVDRHDICYSQNIQWEY